MVQWYELVMFLLRFRLSWRGRRWCRCPTSINVMARQEHYERLNHQSFDATSDFTSLRADKVHVIVIRAGLPLVYGSLPENDVLAL